MPIEFYCPGCQRLLRVPDETAGRQAQCPECRTITTVPQPQPVPAAVTPACQPTQIVISDVFNRVWTLFKQRYGVCLAAFVILMAINFVVGFGTNIIADVALRGARNDPSGLFALVAVHLASSLFSTWIATGQAIFMLNVVRGRPADFADIFRGGPYFLRVWLASLLVALIVFVGLLLCIVPGVIFALMFSQCMYLIVDRNVGIMQSLTMSREITTGNKASIFVIGLLAGLLGTLLALVTCGLGLFAVGPYWLLLPAVIYLTMTGQPTGDQHAY